MFTSNNISNNFSNRSIANMSNLGVMPVDGTNTLNTVDPNSIYGNYDYYSPNF